jgi:ankyrin repeat protein
MVKVLLSKGADPNLRGPGGANALTLAKDSGRAELIQLLESHGARP